jgi:transposase
LVIESLYGNFREEHLFALNQDINAYEFYQKQVLDCDKQIEALLNKITFNLPAPQSIKKPKPIRHNRPQIDNLHPSLMKLTRGNDPSQITGMTDSTLLQIISEVGTDMSRWPTVKHFTSWLGLAPNSNQSGITNKKKFFRHNSIASQIFRISAQTLVLSKYNALGAFYRRLQAKKGKLTAMKATARKLAVIYYNVMTEGVEYVEYGINNYEQKIKFISFRLRTKN